MTLSLHRVATAFACLTVTLSLFPSTAAAQYDCSSPDPADWPPPSRPYFMLAVDTSGSMTTCTNPPSVYPTSCGAGATPNSCGWEPTRYNDAKCALLQTVLAFAGEVNFGLSTYAVDFTNCPNGTCQEECVGTSCGFEAYGCDVFCVPGDVGCTGCGPGSDATRQGGMIQVPMLQDDFWSGGPPPTTNVPELLDWFDWECGNDAELFAAGNTPLNGILRDMYRYFDTGWTDPRDSSVVASPLDAQDRACRDVNVILITDGDDTCDTGDPTGVFDTWAEHAADQLFTTGVTKGGKTWNVRTHVINFAGGTQSVTDAIAAAGGGVSASANNEVQLAQELAGIVAGAMQPEVCDNEDNNCNGCVDEGYKKYCNVSQTCCSWTTDPQRDNCLAQYEASVIASPPTGDLNLLPCTSTQQQTEPDNWLCYDPGDICDDVDNNCQAGVDESQLKCGNPLHCPSAEVCDGIDNDCNGQIDDGAGCTPCTPSAEICDGCDNDCDGVVDNGTFANQVCGLPTPAYCQGSRACAAPQAAPFQGGCVAGAGYGVCNNSPTAEVCDGEDNNCNGSIDEGFMGAACVPPTHPAGLVYDDTFAFSECKKGTEQCAGAAGVVCVGGKGPSPLEICDGLDNDCDGFVDAADPGGVFGVGQECGTNQPPCSPGLTACVNGALVCQGGNPPQNEICDDIDNDCDGSVDEAPLFDAPMPGMTGCWTLSGTTCSHGGYSWDPPMGQTDCHGLGTLTAPCAAGVLQCVAGGWTCNNAILPEPEVCDGNDNDCNGVADDGNLPQVGDACGPDTLPCVPGVLACDLGSLVCVGGNQGTTEDCNNIDDDCNGLVDDGIPNMGVCTMPYDANDYPGDRSNPPCQPGQLECDGMGNWICVGGKGPSPEVCDGLDNDCDASLDETGAAPDGLDGTANPFPPPNALIGEACGDATGTCAPGSYVCDNGLFQCFGGQGPVIETCDCDDNDCDGDTDEAPQAGEPPLCSPGKDCIAASDFCQCASPCSSGEYPCPPGQICEEVTVQGSGGVTDFYCVINYQAICGDCSTKTFTDGDGTVTCAPAGTDPPGCLETPECTCKLQNGCREPCFDVDCAPGKICASFGPTPGKCVDDICYQTGCPGCNEACHDAECVDNPCKPGVCAGDEACKPNPDWNGFICQPSCADVACPGAQKCQNGVCVPWCDPLCANGEVCDPSTQACVPSQCDDDSCPNGAYCDPLTGACGDDPCSGVTCPAEQACVDGECARDGEEPGTGGSAASTGGAGGATSSGQGGAPLGNGVFGLPGGGGGCFCDMGATRRGGFQGLALFGLGVVLFRRRRSREVRP